MKYCLVDGTRYPDAISRCRVCGAPLFYASTPGGFPSPWAAGVATSGCPNPECSTLVSLPGTTFCGQCGKDLVPLSLDLWVEKIVAPAFAQDPVQVLLNTASLLPPVAELGLDREEAMKHLDQFLVQRVGTTRLELVEWLRDAMTVLTDQAYDLEAGKRYAEELATERKISSSFASSIVEQFARDIASAAAADSDVPGSPDSLSPRNVEGTAVPTAQRRVGNLTPEQQTPAAILVAEQPPERGQPASALGNNGNDGNASGAITTAAGGVEFSAAPQEAPSVSERSAQQEVHSEPSGQTPSPEGGHQPDIFTATKAVLAFFVVLLVVLGFYLIFKSPVSAEKHESPPVTAITKTESPSPSPSPSPPAGMVYVAGGEFQMGGNDGALDHPSNKIPVDPFYLDKSEVTCAQYQSFLGKTERSMPPGWEDNRCPPGSEDLPVTGVDWYDALAYAEYAKKRLPREEEWEFAARGEKGQRYPWGNVWISNAANAGTLSQGRLTKVCQYEAGKTSSGICDLIGNAWEWTATNIAAYPEGKIIKRVKNEMKVIRGGAYDTEENLATASYRGYWRARGTSKDKAYGTNYSKMGFRCAASIPKS